MSIERARSLTTVAPWVALALLAVPGLGTSSYLTYSHYADEATICAGVGSCELVQTSSYSTIAGVPVALMGLLYFIAVAALAAARLLRIPWVVDWGTRSSLRWRLAVRPSSPT